MSLVVISAGIGDLCLTRLLADQIAESACWSLTAGGARVEVEVLELRRLATDLAQHSALGHVSPDLCEAIAAVAAADGLVVVTPVVGASPSDVFESFFGVLEDGVLSGAPVLLAATSHSRGQSPDVGRAMRGRLTRLHAELVPTVVVAGPEDWEGSADSGSRRLRDRIDQAAAELAATVGSPRRPG
jgi:FMN reductase